MLVTIVSLRLLGLILGIGLYGFCAYLFLSKSCKTVRHWAGFAIVALAAAWHTFNTISIFYSLFSVSRTVSPQPGATIIYASLVPVCAFLWSVRRRHVFGLFIRRRMLIAIRMSLITAVYLLLVRNFARYAEGEFDAYGRLVEVALILAAAVVWLPLYAWLARRQARRLENHAAFSKMLMEEAAGILEPHLRMQFMAERVRQAFGFRRLVLTAGELIEPGPPPEAATLREFEAKLADRAKDFLFAESAAFNYVFPLRYEDRLLGLCLIDSSPRFFLDEDEAALVSLCRQMAHSIEASRRVEEKIRTETLLLRQEHLATIGTLAASIAHEVKNPLSAIKTLVQVMTETPDLDEQLQRDLSFMRSEIDRLSACVQQLLTYSRPFPQQAAELALGDLMRSTAMLLANDHAEKHVRIECRIAPAIESEMVDYQAVQQVILNLGLNAAQAVSAGGLVELSAVCESSGGVLLSVTDDGPGIAPEEQQKIFEPFYSTKALPSSWPC
jgi:signal transduction histidine kinase